MLKVLLIQEKPMYSITARYNLQNFSKTEKEQQQKTPLEHSNEH